MSGKRLQPHERREAIIEAGLSLFEECGVHISRDALAERAGVSTGLVSYHFGHMGIFMYALISEGCKRRVPGLILAGLAEQHPDALALPASVKKKAL